MIFDLSNNHDLNKSKVKFNQMCEEGKVIDLTEKRKKRTIKQNAYLHVAIQLFAIEVGYNIAEAKTKLKRECLFMRYEKGGEVFLKSTSDLDTKKLTDFIDFIMSFAGVQGIYIPTPEEYILNQIEIDRQISANKQYL